MLNDSVNQVLFMSVLVNDICDLFERSDYSKQGLCTIYHDPSDLGSLIQIPIIPMDRTRSSTNQSIRQNRKVQRYTLYT